MAYTKMKKPIKKTIHKAIDYFCNNKKTNHGNLITLFGLTSLDSAANEILETYNQNNNSQKENIARHLLQSFKPGEISGEKAHELGLKLCKEYLGDKFQYILSTHVDKKHIHNHIIFSNISWIDYKGYKVTKDDYKLKEIADRICKENGLSVIDTTKEKEPLNIDAKFRKNTKTYFEQLCLKKGISWKEKLKYALDLAINKSNEYEEFKNELKNLKINVEDNKKYLKIKHITQEKYIRVTEKNFGKGYTRDGIKEKLKEKRNLLKEDNKIILDKKYSRIIEEIEKDLKLILEKSNNFYEYKIKLQDKNYKLDEENNKYIYLKGNKIIEMSDSKLNPKYKIKEIQNKFDKEKFNRLYNQFIPYEKINGLKYAIDTCIKNSKTYEEFLINMQNKGYLIEKNNLKFKPKNFDKYIEVTKENLGNEYLKEKIKERINNKNNKIEYEKVKEIISEKITNQIMLEKNVENFFNNFYIMNKYNLENISKINIKIKSKEMKIEENKIEIEKIKSEIEKLKLINLEHNLIKINDLNVKVIDLFNENKFINNEIKVMEKLKINHEKFIKVQLSKDKKIEFEK